MQSHLTPKNHISVLHLILLYTQVLLNQGNSQNLFFSGKNVSSVHKNPIHGVCKSSRFLIIFSIKSFNCTEESNEYSSPQSCFQKSHLQIYSSELRLFPLGTASLRSRSRSLFIDKRQLEREKSGPPILFFPFYQILLNSQGFCPKKWVNQVPKPHVTSAIKLSTDWQLRVPALPAATPPATASAPTRAPEQDGSGPRLALLADCKDICTVYYFSTLIFPCVSGSGHPRSKSDTGHPSSPGPRQNGSGSIATKFSALFSVYLSVCPHRTLFSAVITLTALTGNHSRVWCVPRFIFKIHNCVCVSIYL